MAQKLKRIETPTEIQREGSDVTLRLDYAASEFFPSLEDNSICMAQVMDQLIQNPGITRVVFYQKRDYEYDFEQVTLLTEIAKIQNGLVKKRAAFSPEHLGKSTETRRRYIQFQNIVYNWMKADPVGAYVELKRLDRHERILLNNQADSDERALTQKFLNLIAQVLGQLDKTKLILMASPYLAGYDPADRSVYRRVFSPTIKPDFMFTKLMAAFPQDGEEIDNYTLPDDAEVTIFKLPDTVQLLYHLTPPEFKLSEDKYMLLDEARRIISEHRPERSEFVNPGRMRQVFQNVGSDLLEELSDYNNIRLRSRDIDELTKILIRHSIGFGLIEVLLSDAKVQDITINSPMGKLPMFIVHQEFDDCTTNIIPAVSEGDSWASKMRLISGRPLDEANPIIDTELLLPYANARVAAIAPPLNPSGLAFAFRRHRDRPWTLPLMIQNRMMTPLAAGMLSFLVDGSRTMLVAGTRSAGKTSLLGAVMTEIMRKYRIITVEDTLELPVPALRELGFNVQSMKVASALTQGSTEAAADEGIRSTLRLGDSALIVGEVRSTEARALYEAMRVGALANVVAGTIHGDSPYGVFDRVVNDLGVPRTSFKATDIVVVANPIRSADGLHRWRRVTQITEVGKQWEQDPLAENGFRDLLKYDAKSDQLKPTSDLLNGESDILKGIAGNVKEWAGNWDAVWNNVLLRAKIKERLVEVAEKAGRPEILEAEFTITANDSFHRISDKIREELGSLDEKRILFEWEDWLKNTLKKNMQR
ncbi:type II/IV secretion system ATPase subunit [Candidatus Woesearchaeota archaeon]|nr:type II/IV secretion system ATPase subunit [Candidatus Woesearchaeota archaeon]